MSISLFMLMIFFMISCTNTLDNQKFPFYRQSDVATCGPTCLRMIFKHYGKDYSEEYLNKVSHVDSIKGISMLDLFTTAETLGFNPEGIEVDFQNLAKNVDLPCIAYWKSNHFVVVYKIEDSKVYVADPSDSLRIYTKKEFCDLWEDPKKNGTKTGYALMINKIKK